MQHVQTEASQQEQTADMAKVAADQRGIVRDKEAQAGSTAPEPSMPHEENEPDSKVTGSPSEGYKQ